MSKMKRSLEKVVEASANPDLDIFSPVFIQTSIKSEQIVDYFPIGPLAENQPIQFEIPESFTQMTAPNFLLKVKAKLTKADGTALAADAKVAPTNLTLHSLFTDVILKLNGVAMNQASGAYPYRAYIETNYTYSQAAKDGAIGIPQMYYQEKVGEFESVEPGLNPSFDKRKVKFVPGNEVQMAGRLHCDLLLQNKLIVPGIRFSITMYPTTRAFRILADPTVVDVILTIKSAVLRVKRVNLSGAALLSIERAIQQKPAKYQVARAAIRTTQIVGRQTYLSNFVLHSGQLPRLVLITLVYTEGFEGSTARNPFNFSLNRCKFAQLEANGVLYPALPYNCKESYIEPYLNALQVVNKLYADSSTGITYDDFLKDGHPILTFDLRPSDDVASPALTSPRVNGVLTFNSQWETWVDNCTLVFYILWDNIITIDARRNIILDFVP